MQSQIGFAEFLSWKERWNWAVERTEQNIHVLCSPIIKQNEQI
jgi:hypothetical protein